MVRTTPIAIGGVVLLLAAFASAADVTIQVGNPSAPTDQQKFQFSPRVTRVSPGDNVRFFFNGQHSVTQQANLTLCQPGNAFSGQTSLFGGPPFDSGVLQKGQVWPLPQSALVPGSVIYYYCKVGNGAHCRAPNFMQGALVVAGGSRDQNQSGQQPPFDGSAGVPSTPAASSGTAFSISLPLSAMLLVASLLTTFA